MDNPTRHISENMGVHIVAWMKYGLSTLLLIFTAATGAAEPATGEHKLQLSPELRNLLLAEMREIAKGMQALAPAIATADWKTVADTGAMINQSYIMEQKLTAKQRQELENALPDYFKRLDMNFHREADKLAEAAAQHDGELASFHFYKLTESCVSCHATYAKERFPGFTSATGAGHGH